MHHWLARFLLLTAVSWSLPSPSRAAEAIIAIIIDDIGYNLAQGDRALQLPGNLTYSILPHTRFGRYFAEQATRSGREVMLHLPMENLQAMRLGPGALTRAQDQTEFLQVLRGALADIPHIAGINNHMGSRLTQEALPMSWLMGELFKRNFYFVDSMTTPKSVAHVVARRANLLETRRDVFLDHEVETVAIDQAFGNLLRIARQHGSAVAIGHPYRETMDYLAWAIPLLEGSSVRLLPASAVAAHQLSERRLLALGPPPPVSGNSRRTATAPP